MNRYRESSPVVFLRSDRKAPVPVSRKQTGAQMFVIQLVANIPAVAVLGAGAGSWRAKWMPCCNLHLLLHSCE